MIEKEKSIGYELEHKDKKSQKIEKQKSKQCNEKRRKKNQSLPYLVGCVYKRKKKKPSGPA